MVLALATSFALLWPLAHASDEVTTWRIQFDQSGSRPVIADRVVYVGSAEGVVHALDLQTGEAKWRLQTGATLPSFTSAPLVAVPRGTSTGDQMSAGMNFVERMLKEGIRRVDMTPAVQQGTVFVGSGDQHFYAIEAATGKERWSYRAGSGMAAMNNTVYPVPAPVLRDDTVYFVSEDGLHALDPLTGQRKWLFETLQDPSPPPTRSRKSPPSGPMVGDDAIFLTAWARSWGTSLRGSFVYAVDPTSGKAKWVTNLQGQNIIAPATAKGLVFAATDVTLYAMDSASGQVKWQYDAERKFGTSGLLVDGNAVYFRTDKQLAALDLETGRLLWRFEADQILPGFRADSRHLYIGTRNAIRALALESGQEKWSRSLDASIAVVQDGVVYAHGKRVYAIDAATGKELWSFSGTGRESALLVSDGRVFLMSPTITYVGMSKVTQGYLYAIDAKTGALKSR